MSGWYVARGVGFMLLATWLLEPLAAWRESAAWFCVGMASFIWSDLLDQLRDAIAAKRAHNDRKR